MRVKLDGIYDKRTIKSIKEVGVVDYGFDFRPRSFNFLQGHLCQEIVQQTYDGLSRYYFHFCNEQHYIIEKIFTDVINVDNNLKDNILLEFSDIRESQFYDQFRIPFFWHYDPSVSLKEIVRSKYLKGIVLQYNFLEESLRDKTLNRFASNFYTQMFAQPKQLELELILQLEWGVSIKRDVINTLDFDKVALPVNSEVEICYRNVNQVRLKSEINSISGLQKFK
ncbi:MAG: hypothetical protein ISR65_17755 [Bacteriovoracaceae bacterium]|nr:hypothetical protein [Bacteriovoracaceae bacterium]